jgi:hypothetical protein
MKSDVELGVTVVEGGSTEEEGVPVEAGVTAAVRGSGFSPFLTLKSSGAFGEPFSEPFLGEYCPRTGHDSSAFVSTFFVVTGSNGAAGDLDAQVRAGVSFWFSFN